MPEPNNAGNTATQQAAGGAGSQNGGVNNNNANGAGAGQSAQQNSNAGANANNQANATSQEKKFSQSEVDEFVKERLERANNSFLKHCGVKTQEELDAKLSDAVAVKQENILIKNNIASERYDDVLTHFKGKGQELTSEALVEALKTHPEWASKSSVTPPANNAQQNGQSTTVKNLGAQQSAAQSDEELDFIEKHFGVRPKKV